MTSATRGNAIVVGIPEALRPLLEKHFKEHVDVRVLELKKDGGFKLKLPPRQAADLLEKFAQWVPDYANAQLLLLPYSRIPDELAVVAADLASRGMSVVEPRANTPPWPANTGRMDQDFLRDLLNAICGSIESQISPQFEANAEDMDVACEVVRGLVTHSKLGPNNHSHEDDMWKSRGKNLGPGGRARVVDFLLANGILDRKKNNSAGGTGWVYWIADAPEAERLFPTLTPYFR